jgi:o-succinylbenzoate synthase
VKPARRDWRTVAAIHPSAPLLLTSAMDHPLGQSYAAYEAALAWQQFGSSLELTGLCTQHLFEPDAFSARLGMALSTLQVDDSGTGLGFDAELADLPWMELRDFLKG